MLCPCSDNKESFVLYQSDHKKNTNYVKDVKCMSTIHSKPTLYKCKKCDLIFSEYINVNLDPQSSEVDNLTWTFPLGSPESLIRFSIDRH